MRAARNIGYLILQFRTLLASPLTSFLQNTPNNQFVSVYYSPPALQLVRSTVSWCGGARNYVPQKVKTRR